MRTERKIKPQTKNDIPRVTRDRSVSEATAGGAGRGVGSQNWEGRLHFIIAPPNSTPETWLRRVLF